MRRYTRRVPRSALGEIERLEDRTLLSLGGAVLEADGIDPSRILVRYRDSVPAERVQTPMVDSQHASRLVPGLFEVRLAPGVDVHDALTNYRTDPFVLYAEPSRILQVGLIPEDPSFGSLWGLNNTGQSGGTVDADIDAPEAWDMIRDAPGVIVAVIDTGIDLTHPDLAANLWVNDAEANGSPGVDDDGNGYVDDIHGYDFINEDGNPMDDHGHGTHVAGTIGAVGDNGVGVVGVTWTVRLMALKFLGANGSGSDADAIRALEYAVSQGAMISNNSYGDTVRTQAFEDAIAAAGAAGHLFVAAAGNSNVDADGTPMYPAAYDLSNVISVAASTRTDGRASFSNYGLLSVDLAAPGTNILSTAARSRYSSGYATFSGTSMAAPHVAGAAALVWAANPAYTAAQVKQRLLDTVDPLPAFTGRTVSGGRLNVAHALTDDIEAPLAAFRPVHAMQLARGLSGAVIEFSEPVVGLSLADLSLSSDGTRKPWDGTQTVTSWDGGRVWVVENLTDLSQVPGNYTLSLQASALVQDLFGNALGEGAALSWRVASDAPAELDFRQYAIAPFSPEQDLAGGALVEEQGEALRLSGNTWKKLALSYVVTPRTILEFEYESPADGEIHAIGLVDNPLLDEARTFQLHGSQSFGVADFRDYNGTAPRNYRIELGTYMTGPVRYLILVNDEDVNSPTAQSVYRNVRIYEDAPLPPPVENPPLDFSTALIEPYSAAQDVNGTATVEEAGAGLRLTGNTWKRIALPYTVTPDTVLEFEFRQHALGEVFGIGLDDNTSTQDASRTFQLAGTQTWAIQAHRTYTGSNWVVYQIRVGQFFTGAMNYLVLVNDHDVSSPTASSSFRNVRIYEDAPLPPPVENPPLDFSTALIEPYSAAQDVNGTATVEEAGAGLRLTGNTWKRIALPYTVTPDTVLEFEFRQHALGEVFGIGLDDNTSTQDASRTFQLAGTQTWAIQAHRTYTGSNWVVYQIRVGQFFTGAMNYLVLVNDHDVSSPTASSSFRNVRIYEDLAGDGVTQIGVSSRNPRQVAASLSDRIRSLGVLGFADGAVSSPLNEGPSRLVERWTRHGLRRFPWFRS